METDKDSKVEAVQFPEESYSSEQLPIFNVFSNSLLLDKIVELVIRGPDNVEGPTVNPAAVRSLRAVGKIWNDSVVNVLHRKGLPFLTLTPGFCNYDEIANVLSSFTKTFCQSSTIVGSSPPPSHVHLHPHVFRQINQEAVYNFFLECGPVIADLDVTFPMSGGSLQGPLPTISLPFLKNLTVDYGVSPFNDRIRPPSQNVASIIQPLFNGATALKTLVIMEHHPRLKIYDKIVLPPVITELDLNAQVTNEDAELLLLKSYLPNVATLTFSIMEFPMKDHLLSRILEKYRKTLKELKFFVEPEDNRLLVPFRFPVMEKLQVLDLTYCRQLEMEIDPFVDILPNLRILKATPETTNVLEMFMTRSRFSFMAELEFSREFVLDSTFFARICTTFSNVVKLDLSFRQSSGLQCIFAEMRKLVDLRLSLVDPHIILNSDIWDALLIGVPVGYLQELRTAPRNLVPPEIVGFTAIRNLKDLRRLSLGLPPYLPPGSPTGPLISDLAFHFAFLKMPRLQKLDFSGRFSVSAEMTLGWRQNGRILKHKVYRHYY